jgi:hypothetical protein
MTQPRGLRQCLRYNDAAARFRCTLADASGLEVYPSSGSVKVNFYEPDGTAIGSSEMMTAETPTTTGFLKYDAQTVEFKIGEVVTGAGGSSGTIVSQTVSGSTGVLYLAGCDGVFVNNEALTGNFGGAATVDGVLFSCTYYFDVATSAATGTWVPGQNYRGRVAWTTGVAMYRDVYFDVAYYPAGPPLVSSQEVDNLYPTLSRMRKVWRDWEPAITMAHAELLRRIDSMGENASDLVGRETDLWGVEMYLILAQIAESLGMEIAIQDRWKKLAEQAWAALPPVRKATDDDLAVEDEPIVMSCKLTR